MQARTQSGQPLARLAELAEVVSRRQHLPFGMGMSMLGNPLPTDSHNLVQRSIPIRSEEQPVSVSAVLRKRPSLPEVIVTTKRPKLVAGKPSSTSTSDDEDDQSDDSNDELKDVRFREYQAEIWSEKFEDLCEFRRLYGHCHVPHTFTDNAPLAQWVKRQRYQFKLKLEGKRSTLSDERVRLLNQIGFIWNSHDVVWEERWYELLAFKQIHGHCIVPSNYDKNPQLAIWVKRQRRQFKFWQENKPTSMTPERIEKLDKLGFSWDCRKNNPSTRPMKGSNSSGEESNPRPAFMAEVQSHFVTKNTNPQARNTTVAPLNETIKKATGSLVRPMGGFPLPRQPPPPPPATTAMEHRQIQGNEISTRPLGHVLEAPSISVAQAKTSTPSVPSIENLPCEFLSFSSRKFTKFPKINLSK